MRRRPPTAWLAIVALAATLVVPAAAGADHGARHGREGAPATYAVPVRACRTETATAWHRGPRIARQRDVAIPARLAEQSALYTDEYSTMAVLGPRGWQCSVSIGTDDQGLFFVYAPGEPSPGFFPDLWPPRRSDRRELVVVSNPACVSCVLSQACPYFAHARHLMHLWGYWTVTSPRACSVPRGERVTELGPTLMRVVDPPRVLGNLVPSGGRYAALGEVGYSPVPHGDSPQGSFSMSCVLPPRDHALCYASLHWYARPQGP